jgi:hypothetical protein
MLNPLMPKMFAQNPHWGELFFVGSELGPNNGSIGRPGLVVVWFFLTKKSSGNKAVSHWEFFLFRFLF